MKLDTHKTIVVFRVFKDQGDLIALFPALNDYHDHSCESYQHIGQHGAADYRYCISVSRPAKPSEYAALKSELKGIGYNLDVRTRYTKRGVK